MALREAVGRDDVRHGDVRDLLVPGLTQGLTQDRSKAPEFETVPAPEVGFTRLQPCLVTKSGKPDLVQPGQELRLPARARFP